MSNSDAGGGLLTDPQTARSPEELMDLLREFRSWHDNPSYRVMEAQCKHEVSASTFCTVMKGSKLPKLRVVAAVIEGCGGSSDDVNRYVAAGRKLVLQQSRHRR